VVAVLKIRAEQVPAIVGEPIQELERHVLEYVGRCFPHELEQRGEDAIAALVTRAIGEAVGFGLSSSVDVTGLLSLMLLLGDDFLAQPRYAWVRELLGSPVIHGGEKIGMILDALAG